MSVFQALQRAELSAEAHSLQMSDRIYGVQQQVVLIIHVIFQTNCHIVLAAGVLGSFLSPGIITIICFFHNVSTTLFHLLTMHDLNESRRGGFSYHYHFSAHLILLYNPPLKTQGN